MADLLAREALLVIGSILLTYVVLRGGNTRPVQLLVVVLVLLMLTPLANSLHKAADDRMVSAFFLHLVPLFLALLTLALLLLLSLLFVPEWWQGRKPIRWIVLPYAFVCLIFSLDLLAGTGMVFTPFVEREGPVAFRTVQPHALVALIAFSLGWLPHIGMLIAAFVRMPQQCLAIGLLIGAMVIGVIGGQLISQLQIFVPFQNLVVSLPIMITLAYAVLTTRLLLPTRAAFDRAVAAMRDSVLVIDTHGEVVYANPAAQQLGLSSGRPIAPVLKDAGVHADVWQRVLHGEQWQPMLLADRHLQTDYVPVQNQRGRAVGFLLMGRDVTELEQRTADLERERKQLRDTVAQLADEQARRAELDATVRTLALPIIPVKAGVLVLPLVGEFDALRAADLTNTLLHAIERERARMVLIDITGVPLLDTSGAGALIQATRAAALLGTRCMLVGVRPEIAQTLVSLGVSLSEVPAAATLQEGLRRTLTISSH